MLLPVLVALVTYARPLEAWYTANLKYRDAEKAYTAARERYLEFTVDSFSDAESYFTAALSNKPSYAQAHAALGELYSAWVSLAWYHGEDWHSLIRKAMDHSLSAVSISPQMFETHRSLAAALNVGGSSALAVNEADQALALRPADREAKFWKWVAEGERYDTAYFTAVDNDPSYDFLLALVRIGFALKKQDRPIEARKFFERARQLAQNKRKEIPLIYVGIGDIYVNQAASASGSDRDQALETAIQHYRRAVELDDRLMQ